MRRQFPRESQPSPSANVSSKTSRFCVWRRSRLRSRARASARIAGARRPGARTDAAPADLDALAARALRAFAESEPLALVVAPADAERVSSPLPVRVDPALVAGDLLVAVRDGEIDARFALRLAEATADAERA